MAKRELKLYLRTRLRRGYRVATRVAVAAVWLHLATPERAARVLAWWVVVEADRNAPPTS